MAKYNLSEAAKDDLYRLYIYGVINYGLEQTEQYVSGMRDRFEELAAHPKLYPTVNHIRAGYRRCVYGAHSIYYRILDDEIIIVRVLGRPDPVVHL